MATFVPPMLGGTVVFIRGYNPNDIVRHIKARRVSVLVSVPKILDVLREHARRIAPDVDSPAPQGEHFRPPLVAIPDGPPDIRPEVLELHRRRRPARP